MIVMGRMDVKVVDHSRRVLVRKKSLGFKMKEKRCKKFKKTNWLEERGMEKCGKDL